MAYFDRDNFLIWLPEPLPDEIPADSYIHPMEPTPEPEAEAADPEASLGYIVRDWFGPFLFGPSSRCMRGRC